MNLSHAYGMPPSRADAIALLESALDLGVTHFDTAALYGFGANESLVGEVLAPHRAEITLASKCGLQGVDGKRVRDGRPSTLKKTCEDSLQRLRTDVIDLYYLHRWDKRVPIEESVGALAELVREGKIRAIGLSEVSAATLRRAHAVHPIAALQTEYSLWTRNPEIAVLETCRELGTAFVAFSPLARAFLTGTLRDVSALAANDLRTTMPRFAAGNYAQNLTLLACLNEVAGDVGCTLAQLALAWLLHRGPHVVAIPGTTRISHLEENMAATDISLSDTDIQRLAQAFSPHLVHGERYGAATQLEVDTEEFLERKASVSPV